MKLTGVHCSISGGHQNAILEAKGLGIDTFQIFTKNQRQWSETQIDEETGKKFQSLMKKENMQIAFSHAIYLINLGTEKPDLWQQSIDSLIGEINRCHALGLPYTVLHPGSNPDENIGIKRIADALNIIFDKTSHTKVKVLLENTAGQGNSIGKNFGQIKKIMDETGGSRLGFCFDTCHAYSAGYEIRDYDSFKKTMEDLDKTIGLKHLKAIHLNDSKGEFGKRLDRHEHIGKGGIGKLPFKWIMEAFPDVPKVLETPKEDDMDRQNLKTLADLLKS